jgi:hypothetical protein
MEKAWKGFYKKSPTNKNIFLQCVENGGRALSNMLLKKLQNQLRMMFKN